jgi:hypothetical protein
MASSTKATEWTGASGNSKAKVARPNNGMHLTGAMRVARADGARHPAGRP